MKHSDKKLLDDIIHASEFSSPRLREQVLRLIELYQEQIHHNKEQQEKHNNFLKLVNERTINLNERNNQQDTLLRHQSRMAAMGEMMDAVAHQWRQPLNSLSMMSDLLRSDFDDGLVDTQYITEVTDMANTQIDHMVNTLFEFRNFFRPSKISEDFSIKECIQSVQVLMKDELLKNTVNLKISIKNEVLLHGQSNEFKHLFLNLLSNSIDAFNERDILQRQIDINVYLKNKELIIEFKDNALGIPKDVIADIFKPNFTTKKDGKGTGIGLYMSSQIVQKHNGSISVKNTPEGAVFTISIKL